MGLPNIEYIRGALPKSLLQGVFPPSSTETFTNTSSAWENVSFESMGIHQERRHRGKPKTTTQLRTHSLAPYLGCIMDIQAELTATLRKTTTTTKSFKSNSDPRTDITIQSSKNRTPCKWNYCDLKVWQLTPKCLAPMCKNSWTQYIPFHYRPRSKTRKGTCAHCLLVPWKHTAPDESLHKKRHREGSRAAPSDGASQLRLTASLLGRYSCYHPAQWSHKHFLKECIHLKS